MLLYLMQFERILVCDGIVVERSLRGWAAVRIAICPFNTFESHNVLVGIHAVGDKRHVPDLRFGDHIAFTVSRNQEILAVFIAASALMCVYQYRIGMLIDRR